MVSFSLCSRRPFSTTNAPSFKKRRAVPAPIPEPAPVTMTTLPSNLFMIISNEFLYVLKQKTTRFAVHGMKRHPTLIESPEFDGGEAKLSRQGRDSGAGIGVIARNINN